MSTRETAQSLNLSIKTIESHGSASSAAEPRYRTQLVQYAVNWFTGREAGGIAGVSKDAPAAPAGDES